MEKCGAYKGHSPFCENNDVESLKNHLKNYYDDWLRLRNRDDKWRQMYIDSRIRAEKEAEFWKGKFNTLKIENNSLRKKLNK